MLQDLHEVRYAGIMIGLEDLLGALGELVAFSPDPGRGSKRAWKLFGIFILSIVAVIGLFAVLDAYGTV